MRVWIEQHECVGNGICEEVCPEVFWLDDGDIAYVLDGDRVLPAGQAGTLDVPRDLEDKVIEAAEECPAACIYIEAH
ncbi:MAG TPA: ferredoxin [Acidimicrobiales bacterium]|nr:ferredoxin [Acidimicrobiales bacterium]